MTPAAAQARPDAKVLNVRRISTALAVYVCVRRIVPREVESKFIVR